MSFEMPKTIKKTIYVQLIKWSFDNKPELSFAFYKKKSDSDHAVLADIKEVEIEINLPELEIDLVTLQVTALKNQKEGLLAQTQLTVNHIDQQIQSLMAIEHHEE